MFYKNKERYGVRRIYVSLRNEGILINHKKTQKLMDEMSFLLEKNQIYHSY